MVILVNCQYRKNNHPGSQLTTSPGHLCSLHNFQKTVLPPPVLSSRMTVSPPQSQAPKRWSFWLIVSTAGDSRAGQLTNSSEYSCTLHGSRKTVLPSTSPQLSNDGFSSTNPSPKRWLSWSDISTATILVRKSAHLLLPDSLASSQVCDFQMTVVPSPVPTPK